ncbi:fused response regulator/phosphatase [Litoreibacter roseus]|uniref:Fused response regulator/phosphatase n=2 Tax=Litoreibacter roseus TaxID=2601869 RepID=A0A6N6JHN5_9RHOB|nr:fused response regulator/phosphatase [Litoreibacter roseus]
MTNAMHSDPLIPSDWDDTFAADPATPQQVLVVDDSRMQRKLLSTGLRKWGYEVFEAESGPEGLELCKHHDFSIIVSDWMMPGMDGPEFCQKFRQMKRSSYGYFILLTSKGETREVAEGLNSGADDFLTKPVSFGELKARLKAGERIVTMHAQLIEKNRMVNDALEAIQKLYDSLDRDLIEARKLQQSLVRETDVALDEGNIAMILQPSGHVGGDLVGYFQISSTHLGLFSLDVSGHGVSSALMTARLAGYLSGLNPKQNIALQETKAGGFVARDPADTAARFNEILLRELDTELYFTFALAVLDLSTGKMTCVQAGHPPPIVVHSDKSADLLGSGGLPIGLVAGAEYESFEAQLTPGDRLVLYSDGITECENAKGDMLDEPGFIEILQAHSEHAGSEMLNDIMWDLQKFRGDADFDDDISALVFHYDGPVSAHAA